MATLDDLEAAIRRLRDEAQELGYQIAKGLDDDDFAARVHATEDALHDALALARRLVEALGEARASLAPLALPFDDRWMAAVDDAYRALDDALARVAAMGEAGDGA